MELKHAAYQDAVDPSYTDYTLAGCMQLFTLPTAISCSVYIYIDHTLTLLLLQIAMGAFVNYFFSGFIMGKIPFPLSPSFRLMLQVRRPSDHYKVVASRLPFTVHHHWLSMILAQCCQ